MYYLSMISVIPPHFPNWKTAKKFSTDILKKVKIPIILKLNENEIRGEGGLLETVVFVTCL